MGDNVKPPDVPSQNPPIRQTMVNTATNFLLNPNVIDKPNEHKTAFLRKKGLTDAEITLAYERAETDAKARNIQNKLMNNAAVLPPPVPYYDRSVSFWSKLSRVSSSLIVLGVAIFGAHYVYKTYIEPLIYGEDRGDKFHKLEKELRDMKNSLSQLQKHVCIVEEAIGNQKLHIDRFLQNEGGDYPTPLALRELKSEVASVKSLFLNRHQFPALPKVTPPTIPQWQLPSKEIEINAAKPNGEIHTQTPDESVSVAKPSAEVNSEENISTDHVNGTSEALNFGDETIQCEGGLIVD